MPRTAIVANATGAILTLDPPTREVPVYQETADDPPVRVLVDTVTEVILPEGIDCRVVDLSDAEAAKLARPGSYTVSAQGVITVTAPAPDPAAQLRQQIIALAQSAVGVPLDQLTAAQRNALVACLLHRAGGVTNDLKVKPLAEWVR